MLDEQKAFVEFAVQSNALRFGSFSLKSGRVSPYFFNVGQFDSGAKIRTLAEFYARALERHIPTSYMLFGPAYKGIPLVTATSMALAQIFHKDVGFVFNRKEPKDHGEGGGLIGAPIAGDVVILDDVITAGTAVNHSIELITKAGGRVIAVMVALDRQEVVGNTGKSAIELVEQRHNIPVYAIATAEDLFDCLREHPDAATYLPALTDYRQQFGVKS